MDTLTLIITAIGGGGLATLIQYIFKRKETGAKTDKIHVEAGVVVFETLKDLIVPMRQELKRIGDAHRRCEERLQELENKVRELEEQLEGGNLK